MAKLDWRDILIRAGKTFIQAFLGAWALTGNEFSENALLGAAAAGLSAAWNIVLELFKK